VTQIKNGKGGVRLKVVVIIVQHERIRDLNERRQVRRPSKDGTLARPLSSPWQPPYSPDLNPIEKAWAKLKQRLREAKARTKETLYQAISDALPHITADNAKAWFRLALNGLQ
jgi:transposase